MTSESGCAVLRSASEPGTPAAAGNCGFSASGTSAAALSNVDFSGPMSTSARASLTGRHACSTICFAASLASASAERMLAPRPSPVISGSSGRTASSNALLAFAVWTPASMIRRSRSSASSAENWPGVPLGSTSPRARSTAAVLSARRWVYIPAFGPLWRLYSIAAMPGIFVRSARLSLKPGMVVPTFSPRLIASMIGCTSGS